MPHVPLQLAAFNFDWVGPAFVILFFFVLPIVRAIKESREKQKELEAKRGRMGESEAESEHDAARRKWEALLRGEEIEAQEQSGPWSSPPSATVTETAPPPAPVTYERASDLLPEPVLPGELSPFAPTPTEEEVESRYDEERIAVAEHDQSLRAEMQRRAEFLRAEREGATVRENVASSLPVDRMPDVAAAVPADVMRRRNVLGAAGGPGLGTRAGLRRAILASEILGRPVALRDATSEAGPVGTRR